MKILIKQPLRVGIGKVARGAQHFKFKQTQFAVSDHEKVATATGRVEESQRMQFLVELEQFVAVALKFLKLFLQVVEEQRLDQLEDVLLRGVVRAEVAPRLGVHDALE